MEQAERKMTVFYNPNADIRPCKLVKTMHVWGINKDYQEPFPCDICEEECEWKKR